MRRNRAERRARELNEKGEGPTCFAYHAGRNRWQVRRTIKGEGGGWTSEVVEQ